jgi:glycosyltransferase involved in cell wall biosynthesis
MSRPGLRIGITCRNDRPSLELCLASIARTTQEVEHEVVVIDNESIDGSAEVASAAGARVLVRPWSQTESINYLFSSSRSPITLLLHSDVVMLADNWFTHLTRQLREEVVLVSPDDSGVGPYLRASYGSGHPESSFLLWRTRPAGRIRRIHPSELPRRARARLPLLRTFDLYNLHLTHQLAADLAAKGLSWFPLAVLPSPRTNPWYEHEVPPGACWDPDWGSYEYGFGNFYGCGGLITHYHQWFTRHSDSDPASLNDDGIPVSFLIEAAARFRQDYLSESLKVPSAPE